MNYTFEQLDKIDFKPRNFDYSISTISDFEIKIYVLVKRSIKYDYISERIGLIVNKDLEANSIMKYRIEFQDDVRIRLQNWTRNELIIFATDDFKEIKKYTLLQ